MNQAMATRGGTAEHQICGFIIHLPLEVYLFPGESKLFMMLSASNNFVYVILFQLPPRMIYNSANPKPRKENLREPKRRHGHR